MKKFKIPVILIAVLSLITLFGFSAFATSETDSSDAEITFEVVYTSDSAVKSGISYETYVEPGTLKVGFEIVKDLPIGYVVYDSESTPYIDGIRLNGDTVETLNFHIDENVTHYTITVKTAYADGFLGDLARMSDGVYDWSEMLSNPLVLFQVVYTVLALLSVISGIGAAFLGKKKKVKTADDIAGKVTEASETAIVNVEKRVTDCVIAEIMPIVQVILDDVQNVVKAITLSTSKSKEAPIALLDTLKDSANVTTEALIEKIKQALTDSISLDNQHREENLKFLHELSAEVVKPVEEVSTDVTKTEEKSIF